MYKSISMLIAAALLAGFSQLVSAAGDHMSVFVKQGTFEEVREAVETALTGRGYVINNVSHIGEMLDRTGKDLGGKKQVYLKAEALEFCSATVSRSMMEADPDNIVFCPYIISIYVLPVKPGEVRVAFRNVQLVGSTVSKKALADVNNLLTEIIKEAIQ
jgi:uncharacterized protein (DUF302 family)